MKWYFWILLLVILAITAYFLSKAKNAEYQKKNEEYFQTEEEEWVTKLKKMRDKDKKKVQFKEDYLRFNRGSFSDYGEALAADEDDTFNPICESTKSFNRNQNLKRINYIHSFENTIATSNTMKIYGGVLLAQPIHQHFQINMDYLKDIQGPRIGYGIIFPPKSCITFNLTDFSKFPFFQTEGVFTFSKRLGDGNSIASFYDKNNEDGVFNIMGQDTVQTFILSNYMTDVTCLFKGTKLRIQNQSNRRFYGFIMFKPLAPIQGYNKGGIAMPILQY
jgi:hypothetical protein